MKTFIWTIFICCGFSNCLADNQFISNYVFHWAYLDTSVVENYLTKSVEKSNTDPYAAYILGMLYLEGVILRRDCRKAKHYLLLAAKLGSVEALNAIGDCFYSGDVFPKSTNCALYYYEKAAKSGYGPAQFNAGIVLLNSRKSKTYLLKAVNYLDKASRNSNDLGDVAKHAVKYKKDAQRKIQSIKLPKN